MEEKNIFVDRHVVGRVISIIDGKLTVKKLGGMAEIIVVDDWVRAAYSGTRTIRIHDSAEVLMSSKTVTLNDHMTLFGPPTWWQKFNAWLKCSKYKVFYGPSGLSYFIKKRKVSGRIFTDGFFIPFKRQWIDKPLYFSNYDKILLWNKDRKN